MIVVNKLVEGSLDDALATKLIHSVGLIPGDSYGKKGYPYIADKIKSFNRSAKGEFYLFTLVDFMDSRLNCPSEVIMKLLPHPSPNMVFRVVVRELESWLIADRKNLAKFLKISLQQIPDNPESINDPKRTLVNLARKSSSSKIRSALVPETGSTSQVGKLYSSEMVCFIQKFWNIETATRNAPSLDRCLTRLGQFKKSTTK